MISVDVECWYQLVCRNLTGRLVPPSRSCVELTKRVLSLLREKSVKATFFVLGNVAEAFPELVESIDAEGHEVASHGYTHTHLAKITPDEFREELDRSLHLLTRILGKPVLGFRAPEFSIVEKTTWALDIMAEYGLKYDSSIFPIRGSRYGIADFPRAPVFVETMGRSIIEAPLSTIRLLGRNLPVAGGGYFRLLPYQAIRAAVKRVHSEGRPFLLYIHPYEFSEIRLDTRSFPRGFSRGSAIKMELKSNLFLKTVRGKLARLLDEFRFSSIKEVLRDALGT